MNQVGIFLGINNQGNRGPGIVATNLIKGLSKLSIPWISSLGHTNNPEMFSGGDFSLKYGMLQQSELVANQIDLLGPNVFVMPRECRQLIQYSKALVVPSSWCKKKYEHYDAEVLQGKPIYTWAAGVDTDDFSAPKKDIPKIENLNVMVYFKNRNTSDIPKIIEALNRSGIKTPNIEIVQYGYYSQRSLKEACKRAHVAILYTHTESQGLANLEIMSMGLPCLVVDWTYWSYLSDPSIESFEASSCPYFDDICGMKTSSDITKDNFNLSHNTISEFIENYRNERYNPRDWVIDNFSLEVSAQKYLDILLSIS